MNTINIPARGKWCSHMQCFSLENYIIMTEQNIPRKWKCPICRQKCFDILIDEYFWDILK